MALGVSSQRQVEVGQLQGGSHLASTQIAHTRYSGLGMALGVNNQRQVGVAPPK